MHLTTHLVSGAPSLRQPEVRQHFRQLLAGAEQRGVRTVAYALMGSHIHWLVMCDSDEELRDGTRYLFGLLARRLNRLWGRRGKLFVERYWSVCCRSAKQAFAALSYVLRNAAVGGYWVGARTLDRYTGANEALLGANRFLCSVTGDTAGVRRTLLLDMARQVVKWTPLAERTQLRLPGLA